MQQFNRFSQEGVVSSQGAQALVRPLMMKVYNWMAMGLVISAIVSLYAASNEKLLMFAMNNSIILFLLLLGFVFGISFGINKLGSTAALGLFFAYSALNGLVLSPIFMIYTSSSITSVFFITAGMFGSMSFYGYVTKKDLSGWGSFLFMGLIGLIIASVVNMFLGSSQMSWMLSIFGVIIFVGLTAYDTQKIKNMMYAAYGNGETIKKVAVLGALSLYLDFINMFLYMLRLFGNTRD